VYLYKSTSQPPKKYSRVNRLASNDAWTAWGSPEWAQAVFGGTSETPANVDMHVEAGAWLVTAPATVTGLPAVTATGWIIENLRFRDSTVMLQRATARTSGAPRVFTRVGAVPAATGWNGAAWHELAAGGGTTPVVAEDAGLANAMLLQDFVRRRGGRKKVTTGVISFRFDHGLANFDTKIRPLLEARNIPYSLALCSGQWSRSENVGVTAAMVNGWVEGGLAEVWNHSKDHGSGDNSTAQWQAAIQDGLTELQAQIPAAQIDGWAPPGSSGTDFGGFTNGGTIPQLLTEGGRYILARHAITAGYLSGTVYRLLDGNPRNALTHVTGDKQTQAQLEAYLNGAVSQRKGVQIMIHPSLVDSEGYITTAEIEGFLDAVVTARDAGQVAVMGPYDALLADATDAAI
jgi:hypothetical protein